MVAALERRPHNRLKDFISRQEEPDDIDDFQLYRSTVNEVDINQSVCRDSFKEFLKEFWDLVVPETPVWNWHIDYLCDELQRIGELVIARKAKLHDLIINIPPGTTKSTIVSIMFPAWLWTRDPSLRVICASFEEEMALDFARKSRDVIKSEKYQTLFRFKKFKEFSRSGRLIERWRPSTDADATGLDLREDQNAKGHFENMAHGERKSIGVGGMITGRHAHLILVDDPINPREAISEAGLRSVNHWWDETLPSRKVDKAMTPTILVMQRLHQNDPTGHWLDKKKENLKHICLPAEESDLIKPARLRLKYKQNGGLLDPIRLSTKVLKEAQDDLGKYGYAGQFMQDPIPLGGAMFEVDKIQVGRPPPRGNFVRIVRYWDKAGKKDGPGANTAGVKLGLDDQYRVWILDAVKGQWAAAERERMMKQTADLDGPDVIIYIEQEGGSGGLESAFNSITTTFAGYTVQADVPRGEKHLRAEPLASQVGAGNVWVPSGSEWWPSMRDELRYFPYGKKKDQVDAVSAGYVKLNRVACKRAGAMDLDGGEEDDTDNLVSSGRRSWDDEEYDDRDD